MSRIGKKPIPIPQGVELKIEEGIVTAKGPKGELRKKVPFGIEVKIRPNKEAIVSLKRSKEKALWGTWRSLIANMIEGVSKGFEKKLEIQGVGYKARVESEDLVLDVGFSHQVKIKKREGISYSVEKNIITVSGIDKEKVGQTAAEIRKVRPPEPYKGKGIRYKGEYIRRKVGKKAATGPGT